MSLSLPSQHQSPSLDSTLGIGIPRRAKFDGLRPLVTREDPLHAFVELLGKSCQVLGGVKFGTVQLLWLWVERSIRGGDTWNAPWTIFLALAVTNSPPWSKPNADVVERKNLQMEIDMTYT